MDNTNLLNGVKKVHFIGIGGSGMLPLAEILHGFEYKITGSDINEGSTVDILRGLGIDVCIPHSADAVVGTDLVVYTAALLPGNVELEEAKNLGIKCVERSVLLGAVADLYRSRVCIAGTHGKTTATAMTTQMLLMGDIDYAAVIGGKLPYINGYGKHGTADAIVVEACEFSNTFLQLKPTTAVLLNIDRDHLDFFGSMENLKDSFRRFAQSAERLIIANGDDDNTLDVIAELDCEIMTFGLDEGAHVRAVDLKLEQNGYYSFEVQYYGKSMGRAELGVPGRHNVYNALVAVAIGICEEMPFEKIAVGIKSFHGAGRRFEILANVDGITVADDYAHHPAEVEVTLKAAKQMNFKRVIALHQPFTYSRTKLLFDEFATALKIADITLLTEIMGGREVDPGDITSAMLAQKVGCEWVTSFDQAVEHLADIVQEGDLVITLGCGDIYKAAKMLIERLEKS